MADRDADEKTIKPKRMTSREEDIVSDTLQAFSEDQLRRNTTASHWEEVAELIWPDQRNTFYYGNYNWPGVKKTDRQIDATGMLALSRFTAIVDSLLTPRNMIWHGLEADDERLQKDRDVQLYFEMVTRILFKYRYKASANFSGNNQGVFRQIGAFGNGPMFVDSLDPFSGEIGLRYKSIPIGELFFREDHQGRIDSALRWFRLTARQAYQKWGEKGRFPEILKSPLESNSEQLYNFLHRIIPRRDYDADALNPRRFKYASYYVSIEGRELLSEGGYNTFPIPLGRYNEAPGEVYARSPAMEVLPALKTLNAEKRTFLKQGHRAADPVYLTADDGIVDFQNRPGAMNKGGITEQGRRLVDVLPTGNIQISKEMMAEEKSLIQDVFLVSLFQILLETPQMTATEVIERVNEKGILLAPTVGQIGNEYLGPLIDREIDLCSQMRLLPPMPPVLKEAGGEYKVKWTSPLSRAMRAQEAAGFIRTLEIAKETFAITQDPEVLYPFDFGVAIPEIASINGVIPSWMASEDQIAFKRKQRAATDRQRAQIQAAPAQAAMMKAQAAQMKAGMGVQGNQAGGPQPRSAVQQPGVAGPFEGNA